MKLKQLREAKGWSQEELGRRAVVSVEQIAELESGKKQIVTSSKTLLRLARTLGETVAGVFFG